MPGGHGGPGGPGGHMGGPMGGGPRGPMGGPPPPPHHHYGGWGFRGPYYRSGCLGGCLTFILGSGGIIALLILLISAII